MTSQQIMCFLAVAKNNSFSAAAEQMYLSQSVISYHTKTLERELDFKLFDRDTHGVWLTASGESFYKSMLVLSEEYATAVERARHLQKRDDNHIRICFACPTSSTMMVKIFDSIYALIPDVEITLSGRNQYDTMQPLLSGEADIILTYPGFFQQGLAFSKKEVALMWTTCLLSPRHPLSKQKSLTLEQLMDQTLILPDLKNTRSENARIEFAELFRWVSKNPNLKVNVSARTFDEAQGLAAAGRGIMIIHTLETVYQSNTDGLVGIPLIDIPPLSFIAVWKNSTLGDLGKTLVNNLVL